MLFLMLVSGMSNLVFLDFAGDKIIIKERVPNPSTLLRPFFVYHKHVREVITHFSPFVSHLQLKRKLL